MDEDFKDDILNVIGNVIEGIIILIIGVPILYVLLKIWEIIIFGQ